jgi:hypothetical protein
VTNQICTTATEADRWQQAYGDIAAKTAHAVVDNMQHLFDAFRGQVSKADLRTEALEAIRKHHRRYDPGKSAYNTFAYICAQGRLLDISRTLRRRLRRETDYAEQVRAENRVAVLELPEEEGQPLHEWVERVYAAARYAYRPGACPPKRGRKWFSVPQCIAAVLLMRKLKAGVKGTAQIVREDPRLLRALRMTHAPSFMWYSRARVVVNGLIEQHGLTWAA